MPNELTLTRDEVLVLVALAAEGVRSQTGMQLFKEPLPKLNDTAMGFALDTIRKGKEWLKP